MEGSLPFVPATAWVVPFACQLVAIALLPLVAPHWWEPNRRKFLLSLAMATPVAALYLWHAPGALFEALHDYVSFVVLLGGLFVICGGIALDGDLRATPGTNTLLLAAGTVLASVVGTTGASLLLIRVLLHTNQERRHVTHTVVFFIFLVSNIGGSLSPLGDPPLYLGFLRGVPFFWTLRLLPLWLLAATLLLAVYYVWDSWAYHQESRAALRSDATTLVPVTLRGGRNLVWLLGIIAAAAVLPAPWREGVIVALTVVSWRLTPADVRVANRFTSGPMLEVASIFIGLFITMVPALALLRVHAPALGLTAPWQYFWATGGLSALLDNAPTYVAFLTVAQNTPQVAQVVGVSHDTLQAISAGAVFMGALSYIGNGPNFMVRSIAEARGVRMPTFAGYLVYSGGILLPTFALVSWLFFRG